MSQVLDLTKTFLRNNISTILFLVFIVFAGFSIWSSSQQGNVQAKELLEYTKNTVDVVDKTFTKINKSTSLVPNELARYDIVINDLQDFSRKLNDYASQVPSKNTEQTSTTLQNGLRDFLLTIKRDTIDPLTTRIDKQKGLIDQTKTYGLLQFNVRNSTLQEVKNSIQAGTQLNTAYTEIMSSIKDEKSKETKLTGYREDQKRLDQANEFIKNINGELNPEQRKSLQNIFDGNWPIEDPVFPAISISDLKTTQFLDDLKTLQSYVNDVAKQYNIN